jgi:hypothetical protein
MIKHLRKWLKSFTFYVCQGEWSISTPNSPSEFDCNAEHGEEITCEQCLRNYGMYNPDTGKKDYIRFIFIRFGSDYREMKKKRKVR